MLSEKWGTAALPHVGEETPLGQWWRDMKLARVGGGTDEVLWELVAAGMAPDYSGYASLVGDSNA